MIIIWILVWIASGCDTGQVQHDEGCTSICKNSFYNTTTGNCDNYQECAAEDYLNTTTNACVSMCMYGYFLKGICQCYAGWMNTTDGCVQDINYSTGSNYTLGLDWMYWGLIAIFMLNFLYLCTCYCRIKQRSRKNISNVTYRL